MGGPQAAATSELSEWKLIDPLTEMGAPLRYAIGSWGRTKQRT